MLCYFCASLSILCASKEVSYMNHPSEKDKEDDCFMTSTVNNGVYVVGKLKPSSVSLPKADAKRISAAVKHISTYKKK